MSYTFYRLFSSLGRELTSENLGGGAGGGGDGLASLCRSHGRPRRPESRSFVRAVPFARCRRDALPLPLGPPLWSLCSKKGTKSASHEFFCCMLGLSYTDDVVREVEIRQPSAICNVLAVLFRRGARGLFPQSLCCFPSSWLC